MSSPESLCRICLKASKNLLKFYQNITETERISDRYENFTGIKIKINESESRICKLCFETLKSSSEFKKLCIENDERYRDLLSNAERNTRSKDTLGKIEVVLIKEEIDYSSDDNNQADYHEENYESLEEPSVPIKKEVRKEDKKEVKKEPSNTKPKKRGTGEKLPCAYCGKLFPRQKERRKHERRVHLTTYYCDHCPVTYKRKESILTHLFQHFDMQKARCKLCKKVFCQKREVKEHLKRVHFKKNENGKNVKKEINPEVCPFCGKIFKGQYPQKSCNMHIMKAHTEKSDIPKEQKIKPTDKVYQCDLCGKKFINSKYKLTEHLRSHLGIKSVECPNCDRKFVTKMQQLTHNRYAHKDRSSDKINCPHCKYSTLEKKAMENHLKMHINQKDYMCNICGKTFRSAGSLKEHERCHSKGLEFQCTKCGSKFQRKTSYHKHMLNHERDEKGIGFQCHLCLKILKRQELLDIHLKIHSGVRDFLCMYCEKGFYQKHQLTQHVFSMHLNAIFNCKICGYQMRLRKKFQKLYVDHVRETHKNELTSHQMEMLEIDIKKLKFQDLCPNMPAALKSKPKPMVKCSQCQLHFSSQEDLQAHIENAHRSKFY